MNYVDSHPKKGAFLANQLHRLADLITQQGDAFLLDAGLSLPSRSVSLLLLMNEGKAMIAADLAKELDQPHQLVTQRIKALIELGLVERLDDPEDKRRKILGLTLKGKEELVVLESCLDIAEQVFLSLYQELECDLATITIKAMDRLSSKPMLDRIEKAKSLSEKGADHG